MMLLQARLKVKVKVKVKGQLDPAPTPALPMKGEPRLTMAKQVGG